MSLQWLGLYRVHSTGPCAHPPPKWLLLPQWHLSQWTDTGWLPHQHPCYCQECEKVYREQLATYIGYYFGVSGIASITRCTLLPTNGNQDSIFLSLSLIYTYSIWRFIIFACFSPSLGHFFLEFSYCSCNWHEFKSSLWWPHIQVTFLRDWEPGFEVFESLQLSCPCTLLCSLALQSTWLPGVESPLRSVRSNWQMRAAQISALFCKYINVKVKLHWVCHYCHSFNC